MSSLSFSLFLRDPARPGPVATSECQCVSPGPTVSSRVTGVTGTELHPTVLTGTLSISKSSLALAPSCRVRGPRPCRWDQADRAATSRCHVTMTPHGPSHGGRGRCPALPMPGHGTPTTSRGRRHPGPATMPAWDIPADSEAAAAILPSATEAQ